MMINGKKIGTGQPCYVIAEAGINHNGDLNTAREMIRQAKDAGADAVKFQIITAERSYVRASESYGLFKAIEFNKGQWQELKNCAQAQGIDFFATFVNGQDLLEYEDFCLPVIKISSTNINNLPFLDVVAQQKKPVILSTGLSYEREVDEAVRFLRERGVSDIALLHCTALYPTPDDQAHLRVIPTLAKVFPECVIGFSDHTLGSTCAAAAVALGAKVVEKHFTLDKNANGPDHHFSASPDEMKRLVEVVRATERSLGTPEKKPVPDEMPLREKWRRSLVAARDIDAGETLTADIVAVKRSPVQGLAPKDIEEILGKKLLRKTNQDDPILPDFLG